MTIDKIISLQLTASVCSGLLVAVLNNIITKRKLKQEVKSLEAATKLNEAIYRKTMIEIENLQIALNNNTQSVEVLSNRVSSGQDRLIYDGANGMEGDFKHNGGNMWRRNKDGIDEEIPGKGTGNISYLGKDVIINRTNTEGRYELTLKNYNIDGSLKPYIANDNIVGSKRFFVVTANVFAERAVHTININVRTADNKVRLVDDTRIISPSKLISIKMSFWVRTDDNFIFRIDDQNVSDAPSSLRISELKIIEKVV